VRGVPFELSSICLKTLPPLGWVATLSQDDRRVAITRGAAVEGDSRGLVAGAWSGPFCRGGMANAITSVGSGLQIRDDVLTVICGTAGADMLIVHRLPSRLTIGNSLPLVLAAAGDAPRADYAFYSNDLFSIYLGAARYRATLPMATGSVSVYFGAIEIDAGLRITPRTLPRAPRFSNFVEYRSFLVREVASLFANASDEARKIRYQPIAAVSAGYDSPAAAVVARDAGCTQAFTFRHSTASKGNPDDSGEAIARDLGLSVTGFDTFAYRDRQDFPEVVFASAGFGGGDAYLAGREATFRHRIVVGGGGGDRIWDSRFHISGPRDLPTYLGGYTATKFFLELPALALAVPAIGIASFRDIQRIHRSADMRPWSVGGWYDRPIARRLLEEAGVSRGSFALGKRRVSPVYEEPSRKIPPLATYLSSRSLDEFERWFAKAQPISAAKLALHNFGEATVGRLAWSKKIRRWMRKLYLRWPPAAGRLWHLRMPIRKNAFVFQWSIEQELAKYRKALAPRSSDRFLDKPEEA
jgi:hypothetical protein